MADKIGNQEFVSLTGVLPRLRRTQEEISLHGEDGNSFRETGVKSEVTSLRGVNDPTTDLQADAYIEGLKNSMINTVVTVQQYNRVQVGRYLVLDVREVAPRMLSSVASGGVFGGTEKIEVDFVLIRVP